MIGRLPYASGGLAQMAVDSAAGVGVIGAGFGTGVGAAASSGAAAAAPRNAVATKMMPPPRRNWC